MNKVIKIKDEHGVWIECPRWVKALIDTHFVQLFTSVGDCEWGTILYCLKPKVMDEMNSSLLAPVSSEEIRMAVFQMERLKAPGPDGFQGVFY